MTATSVTKTTNPTATFWTTLAAALALPIAAAGVFVAVSLHDQASAVSSALHQTTQVSQIAALPPR